MAVHHVLNKASTQIQLSSAGFYQMETMVILEGKKKYTNIILQAGCVHLSLHLAELQTL